MLYGELIGADGQALPLMPNLEPEAAGMISPLQMV
jgi:tRNA-2-methylthio-N6-dimethylallyladenosine synthase